MSDLAALALQFESLGGGSSTSGGWGFGCEFGYFQQHAGVEPLGLLRWASITADDLLRGLEADFAGIDDPDALLIKKYDGWLDWAMLQQTYHIRIDHSNMPLDKVSPEDALQNFCLKMKILRRKLLEDIENGEKILVFRVIDADVPMSTVAALAHQIRIRGPSTLLYVKLADEDHPAFTFEQPEGNLLIGYIDFFAPHPYEHGYNLIYNNEGWERLCRQALAIVNPTWNKSSGSELLTL